LAGRSRWVARGIANTLTNKRVVETSKLISLGIYFEGIVTLIAALFNIQNDCVFFETFFYYLNTIRDFVKLFMYYI